LHFCHIGGTARPDSVALSGIRRDLSRGRSHALAPPSLDLHYFSPLGSACHPVLVHSARSFARRVVPALGRRHPAALCFVCSCHAQVAFQLLGHAHARYRKKKTGAEAPV